MSDTWRYRLAVAAFLVGLVVSIGTFAANLIAQYTEATTETAVQLAVLRADVDALKGQFARMENLALGMLTAIVTNIILAGLTLILRKSK